MRSRVCSSHEPLNKKKGFFFLTTRAVKHNLLILKATACESSTSFFEKEEKGSELPFLFDIFVFPFSFFLRLEVLCRFEQSISYLDIASGLQKKEGAQRLVLKKFSG